MHDREKVFDAFRNCITEPKCKDCPWETCEKFHQTKTIPLDLCLDILKLLKEQEPTTFNPHYIDEYGKHFICGVECGSCHEKISRTYHYCPYCGKAVKWE